jgi:uncharacterized protein (DUF2235 family)
MKRLVLCADGTWNTRDQQNEDSGKRCPTNVTKVARAVRPRDDNGVDQVVFYHDGLGTGGGLDRVTGGAFGRGIEDNVRDLYRFILYNWEPGDDLFLFGFSRGAFTVRTLTGFLFAVGLLEKDDDYYVPDVYGCYEQSKGPGTDEWKKAFRKIKNTRPCPPIKFVGVWDTVGSLGAPGLLGWFLNSDKYKYHQVGLNPCIQNAYHALAIDERRKPFAPTMYEKPAGWTGMLEQVWFAGVHSNVGGGYKPDGVANEALHWMASKAHDLGLAFDGNYLVHYTPCFNTPLADSMSAKFKALGEYERPLGQHVAHGEKLHKSVADRRGFAAANYTARNLEAGTTPPIVDTTAPWITRGTPCGDLPKTP